MPKNGVKVGRFRIGNATTLGLRRWRLRGNLDRWLHSAGRCSTGWQAARLVPRAATTTDVAGEYLLLIRAMGTFCALPGIFAYAVPGAIGSGGHPAQRAALTAVLGRRVCDFEVYALGMADLA
ncbi:MAG TPA: hypothetical protein VIH50_09045 [Steroidobacteraceae bacterium]